MAHWVIRCSDLKPTLQFFERVLGCVPIRHEENAEPCAITCNGRYNNAWSKTMVGVPAHFEDEWYCLEVTYNYGVPSYAPDTALQYIAVGVADPAAAASAARALGFAVDDRCVVTGPDAYRYKLLPLRRPEPFTYVKMRVCDVAATRAFYCDRLGFEDLTGRFALPDDCAGGVILGFGDGWQVPLVAVADGQPVGWSSWSGRLAVSMPAEQIKACYGALPAAHVVHELQELDDQLGPLVITIVRDPDGYETCLVCSERFDPDTRKATTWAGPDFAARRKFIDERVPESQRGHSS